MSLHCKLLIGFVALFSVVCIPSSATVQAEGQYPVYHLKLEVNPAARTMSVSGTVRLPVVKQPQTEIPFTLADIMTVSEFRETTHEGSVLIPVAPSVDKGKNHYLLHLPITSSENRPAELSFTLKCNSDRGFVFSRGDLVSFGDANNTVWYPLFGESGNGTGTLEFLIPDGYTAIATGSRSEKSPQTFLVDTPARFAFSVGRYSTLHINGQVPVDGYFLKDRTGAKHGLEELSAIVNNLAQEFGPYPYGNFSIVEVPTAEASGFAGASSAGMILVTESSLDSAFSVPYYAHELSHQWWGNLVSHAEEEHGNEMLDEALAQYGSLTTVEALQGATASEQYRRNGAPNYDATQSARGYFLLAAAGLDYPLASLPERTLSHQLADSKGFLVLDLLARTMGREHFHDALRAITREYRFRTLTWSEFLKTVQENSSQKLDWFFAQWFERTGAPEWHTEWQQHGSTVEVALSQSEPFYRADVEVQIVGKDGQMASKVIRLDSAYTKTSIPSGFPVDRVEVDPHYLVLHWTPEFRQRSTALTAVTRANFERIEGHLDAAQADFEKALKNTPEPDTWGAAFGSEIGLARVAMARANYSEARVHFLNALQQPARPTDDLPWAYYRLATAAAALKDGNLLKWAVAGARTADASLPFPTGAAKEAEALLEKSR